MKNGIACAIGALFGAVVGGVAVHLYERKRCDILIQDEKDKATKFYMDKLQEIVSDELPNNSDEPVAPVVKEAYGAAVEECGYHFSGETGTEKNFDGSPMYVCTKTENGAVLLDNSSLHPSMFGPIQGIDLMDDPDSFGTTGRATAYLNHYSDGVFADADDEETALEDGDLYAYFGNLDVARLLEECDDTPAQVYISNDKLDIDFCITEKPISWAAMKAKMEEFNE